MERLHPLQVWPLAKRARKRAEFYPAGLFRRIELVVAPSLTPDCYN